MRTESATTGSVFLGLTRILFNMKFYRVTSKKIGKGEIVYPQSSYDESFIGLSAQEKQVVEDALNACSSIGKRSDHLFLFCSLEAALVFLLQCLKSGYIYLVEFGQDDFVARYDMNLIDCLQYVAHYNNRVNTTEQVPGALTYLAKEYWNCGKTFFPCYEFLVKKATVKECLFQIEESQYATLKNEYEGFGRNVLEMPTFQELYKTVYLHD